MLRKRLEHSRQLLRKVYVLCTRIIYEIDNHVPKSSYQNQSLVTLFDENRKHTNKHLEQVEKAMGSLRNISFQEVRRGRRVVKNSHEWLRKELFCRRKRLIESDCLFGKKLKECLSTRYILETDVKPWETEAEEIGDSI